MFGGIPRESTNPGEIFGMAGSPGVVRARVRLVHSLREGDALQHGEVLVAPTTAPPWTPLFARAAAILTDTGSFHFSSISPRTFDICRQCMVAGIEPTPIARTLFDSNSLGRLKIFGAVLNDMRIDPSGRVATIVLDRALAAACHATAEDTEGLVNQPLTVKTIQAVAFFKEIGDGDWRVSLRSKGHVNVNSVAKVYGGGGHTNAAGCSAKGALDDVNRQFGQWMADAIRNK